MEGLRKSRAMAAETEPVDPEEGSGRVLENICELFPQPFKARSILESRLVGGDKIIISGKEITLDELHRQLLAGLERRQAAFNRETQRRQKPKISAAAKLSVDILESILNGVSGDAPGVGLSASAWDMRGDSGSAPARGAGRGISEE